MLDQRRRRWAGVVQMLYKWFVFAELSRLESMINFQPPSAMLAQF